MRYMQNDVGQRNAQCARVEARQIPGKRSIAPRFIARFEAM